MIRVKVISLRSTARLPIRLALALIVAVLAGCKAQASDLREWSPSDHDHTANPNATQVEVAEDGSSPLSRHGIDEVTLVAWKRNCTTCHGPMGAGDGPQGPMTGARNLRNPSWQSSTTDESIARAIREGRGRMPGFDLPDSTVLSLVRLVRLLGPEPPKTPGLTGSAPEPRGR